MKKVLINKSYDRRNFNLLGKDGFQKWRKLLLKKIEEFYIEKIN